MSVRATLLAAAALCVIGIAPAVAQGLDLSGIHAQRRESGKICMVDHFHDGSSSGQKTRKAAELAAIKVWQDFTAWEYGPKWGSFALAGSKGVKCDNAADGWKCNVTARPCRRR
jgi:hypothetical protein